MGGFSADACKVAAARRGLIVQRVLVDGWSPAQAAAAFDVGERQVARWVAHYRRRGMASLSDDAAAAPAPWLWARRLYLVVARLVVARDGEESPGVTAPVVLPPRRRDDRSRRR
jgi:hypothetical protein